MEQVSFTRMEDGTAEDWALLGRYEDEFNAGLADRILHAVEQLEGSYGGYQISRYAHSLQAATRAMRDDHDDEYVVAALIHDIGDDLAPFTHGEMVATIMKPFMRDELCWMVGHHGAFQLYFNRHLRDEERNARDVWRGHPSFDLTADFCERYDQTSFDPDYPTESMETFDPMVRRVFAEPRYFTSAT